MEKRDRLISWGLILLTVALLLPGILAASNPDLLVLRTGDEDAYHQVLWQMYQGVINHNVNDITVPAFLSYGWSFFMINTLVALPGFATGHLDWAIILTRLFTVLCAAGSVAIVYRLLRYYLNTITALVGSVFLLCMPAFFGNAIWMHPDFPMGFLLLLSVYFLAKDELKLKRYWFASLVVLGLALGIKLTALLFLPIPACYLVYSLVIQPRPWKKAIQISVVSLGIGMLAVVFWNPTVLIPGRITGIIQALQASVQDNATNHGGSLADITPANILTQLIAPSYLPLIMFGIVVLGFVGGMIWELRQRSIRPLLLLTGIWFLGSFFYNFTQLAKLWDHYYLTTFIFIPFGLVWFTLIKRIYPFGILILTLTVGITAVAQFPELTTQFNNIATSTVSRDYGIGFSAPEYLAAADDAAHVLHSTGRTYPSVLVSPYLPFPKSEFGLTYSTLRRIYGPLSEAQLANYAYPAAIVLQTSDIYFQDLTTPEWQDLTSYPELLAGQTFVQSLMAGQTFTTPDGLVQYEVLRHDQLVVVLEKINL